MRVKLPYIAATIAMKTWRMRILYALLRMEVELLCFGYWRYTCFIYSSANSDQSKDSFYNGISNRKLFITF